MDVALSGDEIINLVGYPINIVAYSDLYKYNNINQLLGENGCCLILYNYGDIGDIKYGHWCCIYSGSDEKGKPIITFFDPYGYSIDSKQMDYIKEYFDEKEYSLYPFLTKLLVDSKGYDIHYNNYGLQKQKENINTCGRWCALSIIARKCTVKQFYEHYSKFENPDEQAVIDTDLITYLDSL